MVVPPGSTAPIASATSPELLAGLAKAMTLAPRPEGMVLGLDSA